MKARFTAQFVTPRGNHAKATRTFKGNIEVKEPGAALAVSILGALMGIVNVEQLDGATSVKITASIIRAKK